MGDRVSEMDEVVAEFLVECHEGLEDYDRGLLSLEQDPGDTEVLGRVFRTMHSIKGTCGFLGFAGLEAVAHAGENLLGLIRDGELAADARVADVLLAAGDAIREILSRIERTGQEGDVDYADLVASIDALCEGGQAEAAPTSAPETAVVTVEPPTEAPAPATTAAADSAPVPVAPADPAPADPAPADPAPADPAPESVAPQAETSIRVDVGLLDHLMNLVGELVLARNQIVSLAGDQRASDLADASARLNLVTTELQEGVMKTRMQPIGNVWGRFPRVVRDLAMQCGKQVRIEMRGQDTELDKTLLEAIKDPLTHLVRNAIDHGIELPEARVAAGKDAEGTLSLSAFHQGGHVIVELADDGAGIDADRIKRRAVERGVLSPEDAERLGEREAAGLIFAPGFSTAEQVTSVSGRGVGMDVVKSNVEQIGGTVDVASTFGEGTAFRLKIPLTLVIIPALVVRAGDLVFAIPQVGLTELVRLEGDDANAGVEDVHGARVFRLRGSLLPIADLAEQIGHQPAAGDGVRTLVVLRTDEQSFGLVVDEVKDTEEIVVKPLAPQVRDISIFAGSTIMGDGRVALILDVPGLAERAGVASTARETASFDASGDGAADTTASADVHTLLVATLSGDRRVAVPLSDVARLEELPAEAVERSGHREVVQYRGKILPLVDLAAELGYAPGPRPDRLRVIVHVGSGTTVGLVVDDIVDIAEDALELDDSAAREGVFGTAVVAGRVTEVLDIGHVVGNAHQLMGV
jgi:two-component system, chemotaxis family, sensor kinase CheA